MLNNKTVAVVIPAYNEETQIGNVIERMPDFVDRIVIVNDGSSDGTLEIVKKYIEADPYNYQSNLIGPVKVQESPYNEAEVVLVKSAKEELKFYQKSEIINKSPEKNRIILINHLENGSVGKAVATGYKWCYDNNIFCVAKMDGDGQMDPAELLKICKPVVQGEADYVKGNRLMHRASNLVIPSIRFLGNSVLSILTKIASGYWRVSDTQTAFAAISHHALGYIEIYKLYPSYGYPNDLLIKLNIAKCVIKEVEIKPVYRIGEKSKMKIWQVIPRISWLLLKGFFNRLWNKYFVRDFHPLFLLYMLSFIIGILVLPLALEIFSNFIKEGDVTADNRLIVFVFMALTSVQFFLFAMWMDIQDNDRLYR